MQQEPADRNAGDDSQPQTVEQKTSVLPTQQSTRSHATQSEPSGDTGSVRKELHWLERLNIFGQLSLALVGIVAAIIYGFQLKTMNGQLNEMRGSSAQTDHLLSLYR